MELLFLLLLLFVAAWFILLDILPAKKRFHKRHWSELSEDEKDFALKKNRSTEKNSYAIKLSEKGIPFQEETLEEKRKYIEEKKRKIERRLEAKLGPKSAARVAERLNWSSHSSPPNSPQNDPKKSGWVYVLRDNSTGLYKIGRTKNISQRMRQLGVGKTSTLIQKKHVSDSYAVEKAAHRRYKDYRLPQTEYFKLNSPPVI